MLPGSRVSSHSITGAAWAAAGPSAAASAAAGPALPVTMATPLLTNWPVVGSKLTTWNSVPEGAPDRFGRVMRIGPPTSVAPWNCTVNPRTGSGTVRGRGRTFVGTTLINAWAEL